MTSILSSGIVEVAIGLAFVYLLLSLLCSVVNEWIAGILGSRAYNLEKGIRCLFTNGNLNSTTSLADAVYDHGLIQSLYQTGFWDKVFFRRGGPAYIPPDIFATTLVNLLLPAPDSITTNSLDSLRGAISKLPDSKGRQALAALANQGQTDLEQVRTTLENWYNGAMDRVAGYYKRRTTLVLFALGLICAVATNTDSFLIAQMLWNNPAVRQATVTAADRYVQDYNVKNPPAEQSNADTSKTGADAQAESQEAGNAPDQGGPTRKATSPQQVKEAIENLNSQLESLKLPVGWPPASDKSDVRSFPGDTRFALFRIFGWLFTAAALSLGAPFWFDLLNKFMVVRSTVKPKEKSQTEDSKD
jgi:hypothetical protein